MKAELTQEFLDYLAYQKRYSENTVAAYQRDLARFNRWLAVSWRDTRSHHISSYVAFLHGKGLAPRSIQRALSCIRSFFAYLEKNGEADQNPAVGNKSPKRKMKLPNLLDTDQAARLFVFEAKTDIEKRDRAIMELLYGSGLRLSELTKLDVRDLQMQSGFVTVQGKGNRIRQVPLGSHSIDAINTWLECRTIRTPEQPLFTSRGGNRISPRSVQARLKVWAQRQLGSNELHPHMLRHSFASHVLESSSDLRAVQELLGHAHITTTQIYTHLDFQHLAKVYDAAHPRAQSQDEPGAGD
ncbi:MAG: tyrosine recombinase XerC [Gammaproteobacteria bacterium]|nr:tyrosine recombinase XerC [Gammaproteobacteria bacterium]MCZ6852489.1 tyrosine recombinase XerC [Gammaproteobacteria bacterium]